jgi:Right handed beta helix region
MFAKQHCSSVARHWETLRRTCGALSSSRRQVDAGPRSSCAREVGIASIGLLRHATPRVFLAVALVLAVGGRVIAPPIPALAAGTVHYVSASGSGTYADSTGVATPCSLSTAMLGCAPGDTIVLRGGTYSSRPTLSRSGTSGSPITVTAYAGEAPVLPGLTVTGSYITLSGLKVTGYSGNGIQAYGPHNIQVINCEVYSESSSVVGSDAGVYFRNGHDLLLQNCRIHDVGVTCVRMIDCSNADARGNVLSDGGEDGITVYGTNIRIEGNYVHGCNSQSTHGDGIVVQAPWGKTYGNDTTGIVICDNEVSDCSQYIYIDSWGQSGCNINGVSIYNNVLYAPSTSQYQTGIPFDCERGNISNVVVYNNTLADFARAGSGGSAAIRWVGRSATYANFTLKNNLISNSRIERDSSPSITNLTMDFNLYYHPGGSIIKWNGTSYNNLSSFRSAQPAYEAHGVQADPALTSTFRLDSGSAASGTGIGPSSDSNVPTADAAGAVRSGSTACIGAYEYGSKVVYPTHMALTGRSVVKRGLLYELAISVAPQDAAGCVRLTMQRAVGRKWRTVKRVIVTPRDGVGRYTLKPRYAGRWRIIGHFSGSATATRIFRDCSASKYIGVK